MSTTSTEIDAVILDILLRSEHGRRWLEDQARREAMEAQLRRLRRTGLDAEIVAKLWAVADTETIDRAVAMTRRQVRALNRVYRQERRP